MEQKIRIKKILENYLKRSPNHRVTLVTGSTRGVSSLVKKSHCLERLALLTASGNVASAIYKPDRMGVPTIRAAMTLQKQLNDQIHDGANHILLCFELRSGQDPFVHEGIDAIVAWCEAAAANQSSTTQFTHWSTNLGLRSARFIRGSLMDAILPIVGSADASHPDYSLTMQNLDALIARRELSSRDVVSAKQLSALLHLLDA